MLAVTGLLLLTTAIGLVRGTVLGLPEALALGEALFAGLRTVCGELHPITPGRQVALPDLPKSLPMPGSVAGQHGAYGRSPPPRAHFAGHSNDAT